VLNKSKDYFVEQSRWKAKKSELELLQQKVENGTATKAEKDLFEAVRFVTMAHR